MASWHPLFAGSAAYAELGDDLAPPRARVPQHRPADRDAVPGRRRRLPDDVARGQRRRVRAPRRRRRRRLAAAVRAVHGLGRAQLRRALGRALVAAGPRSRAQGVQQLRPPRAARVRGQRARERARLARRDVRVRARPRAARALGAAHGPRARAGGLGLHDAGHRLRHPARRHARAEGRRRPARRGARRDRARERRRAAHGQPTSSACCVAGGRADGRAARRRRDDRGRARGGRERHADSSSTAGCCARTRRRATAWAGRAGASATAARACRSTSRSTSCRSGRRPRPSGSRARPCVHVTPGLDGVSRAVNEAERGLLPAEATIVVGQPCAVDPAARPTASRSSGSSCRSCRGGRPATRSARSTSATGRGRETLREAYADRIVARLGSQIANLERATLKRVALSPADLEALNCNLVGGDIYAGSCALDQNLLWRPTGQLPGHATAARRALADRRLHASRARPRRGLRLPRGQAAAAAAAAAGACSSAAPSAAGKLRGRLPL